MAGRRLRETVREVLEGEGGSTVGYQKVKINPNQNSKPDADPTMR